MDKGTTEEIKKAARSLISTYSARDKMLKRYREIYFMDNIDAPKDRETDPSDIKITASPNGRNAVVGIHRLLNTSELQIDIKDKDTLRDANAIEAGLRTILTQSSANKRGRIESDAALACVLFGYVTIYVEAVADKLAIKTLSPYKRRHLEKMQTKTPFFLRVINSQESYPEWDEDMMISHTWRYKIKGNALKSRWGVDCTPATVYTVCDTFTPEHHVVWAEGGIGTIYAEEHGLGCLPVFSAYSGGSDLFTEPEQQSQAFLYAKAKGNLDKRENAMLTAIFTNQHQRGLAGPMVAINSDRPDQVINVQYKGGMRYIMGDARVIDDKIVDPQLFAIKNLLDELDGQSTIQRQTLGENMGNGIPFSSLSLLSNSGKLPLVDPQRALQQVFKDAFMHITYRIQTEAIDNEIIPPAILTDNLDMTVTLTAKLPQDSLRNSQVAQGLGDLVTDEWKHQELLQISDSKAMRKQQLKEQMVKAVFEAVITNPQIMQQAAAAIMGQGNKPPETAPGGAPPPDAAPQDVPPEQMQQGMDQAEGMDMSAMGGMEGMPMTDPMLAPEERPNAIR